MTTHIGSTGRWRLELERSSERTVVAGSAEALRSAIGRAADLRIGTRFRHNEHIDPGSDVDEPVDEVSDFPVTYLVGGRWVAGIMTLRQPVALRTGGFGPASMSFFLYNEDGTQGIARPYLDGGRRESLGDDVGAMPKYHEHASWDVGTNAPSSRLVYNFDHYRFLVRDRWRLAAEVDEGGRATDGSVENVASAAGRGSDLKVGIRGLGRSLGCDDDTEIFVETGPNYFYTASRVLTAQTRPVVRVADAVPLEYGSGRWDFGWVNVRTDGTCRYRRFDPYTLAVTDESLQLRVRWFVEAGYETGG